MTRVQITIDPELRRRAVKQAEQQGISFAEFVRRSISRNIGKPPRNVPVSAIFDLGRSNDDTDIASHKDSMIAEAIEHGRRRG